VIDAIPMLGAACGVLGASGAFAWGAVAPSSRLFGPTICRTSDASAMALTFDDGPNPAVTPPLLDLLDHHGIKATFFLIGSWVAKDEALTKEIGARGHAIGNHTQTHPALTLRSSSRIASELTLCDDAIESATGQRPRWMRPPFGFRSPLLGGIVRQRGGAGIVMWSRWAHDWKPQPAEPVIERLRRARGGDIVLLHDGDHRVNNGDRTHTIEALGYWLPRWIDSGIHFVTLDEF
jgi:peptidoglycan-N-acetylglucosamine deacetylase